MDDTDVRYNFHFFYNGFTYSGSYEDTASSNYVDFAARSFCYDVVVPLTKQFNEGPGRDQPVTFFDTTEDVLPGEDILDVQHDVIERSYITLVVTSEDCTFNDNLFLQLVGNSIWVDRALSERAVLHVHIGEYRGWEFPRKLRMFNAVRLPTNRTVQQNKAFQTAILSALWDRRLDEVAEFIELKNVEDAVLVFGTPLYQSLTMTDHMARCVEDVLEKRAFHNWVSYFHFSNNLITKLHENKTTTRATLIPLLDHLPDSFPAFSDLHQYDIPKLENAIWELQQGSYKWRYNLDRYLYKFQKNCTALVISKFTPNITTQEANQLDMRQPVENTLLAYWHAEGNFVYKVFKIFTGSLVVASILYTTNEKDMDQIEQQMTRLMKSNQSIKLEIQGGRTVYLKPEEITKINRENIVFKKLTLDDTELLGKDAIIYDWLCMEDTDKKSETEDDTTKLKGLAKGAEAAIDPDSAETEAPEKEKELEEDLKKVDLQGIGAEHLQVQKLQHQERGDKLLSTEDELRRKEQQFLEEKDKFRKETGLEEIPNCSIIEDTRNTNAFNMKTCVRERYHSPLDGEEHHLEFQDELGFSTAESCSSDVRSLAEDAATQWKTHCHRQQGSGLECVSLSSKYADRILVQYCLESLHGKHNELAILRAGESKMTAHCSLVKPNERPLMITTVLGYGAVPSRLLTPGKLTYDHYRKHQVCRLNATWQVKQDLETIRNPINILSPVFGRNGIMWYLELGADRNLQLNLLDLPAEQYDQVDVTVTVKYKEKASKTEHTFTKDSKNLKCFTDTPQDFDMTFNILMEYF